MTKRPKVEFRVGTSGWLYKEWAGFFYPHEIKSGTHLEFYSRQFNTVEINATFYHLPLLTSTRGWYERTPKSFLFAVKGSRFITHMKRLLVEPIALRRFFTRIRPLAEKCGPILWQLPPNFPFDAQRLQTFLKKLPKKHRHAIEFRHASWYEQPETFDILAAHNAAHVSVSSLRLSANFRVTTDFTYIRFHGLAGGPRHDYTREELEPWRHHAVDCLRQQCSVYAYFNNDLNTRAPWNALDFRQMVKASMAEPLPNKCNFPAGGAGRRSTNAPITARPRRRSRVLSYAGPLAAYGDDIRRSGLVPQCVSRPLGKAYSADQVDL